MKEYQENSFTDTQKSDMIDRCYSISKDAFEQSRKDSEKAIRYTMNNQWTDSQKTLAAKFKKPTLRYNILLPIINTIVGNEQLTRRRGKIKPTSNDPREIDTVDVLQQRYNALNDEQMIEDKLQKVMIDSLMTKMGGFIERKFSMNSEGYLDFEYEVNNNFLLYLDPETRNSDLSDCKWLIKESWYTLDEILDKYEVDSELVKDEKKLDWWDELTEFFKRIKDSGYSNEDNYDKENDTYKVLEMRHRTVSKVYTVYDKQKDTFIEVSRKQYNKELKKDNNFEVVTKDDKKVIQKTVKIPYFKDAIIYDEQDNAPSGNFGIFPCYAYDMNIQKSEVTSPVDLLLDIQDDINKSKSQIREYVTKMMSGAKAVSYRDKDVAKQIRLRGNNPDNVYEVRDTSFGIKDVNPGNIPPEIFANPSDSLNYISRVSGVNDAMQGNEGKSGESGVLFRQKVRRAAASINPYFKALEKTRMLLLADYVDNFSYVYSEADRPVSIKDESGVFAEEYVNLQMSAKVLNDVSNLSAHVELDEGEDNVTAVEENFERMLTMFNVIAQINPGLADIRTLVENAPIYGKDKMLAYMDQQMQTQAQSAGEQANLEKLKADMDAKKIQHGMLLDEEKIVLENEKIKKENSAKQEKPMPANKAG